MNRIKLFVILRILVGSFFIVSGFEKLTGPYQNFLYVVQSYQLLPSALEHLTARIIPWLEFLAGVFVVLGLWTKWGLRVFLVLLATFMGVVGQAIVRNLPIDECGCFGEFITLPLEAVFLMDSLLWILVLLLSIKREETTRWSLDAYFD